MKKLVTMSDIMKNKKKFRIPGVLTDEEQVVLLKQPNKRYPTGLRN